MPVAIREIILPMEALSESLLYIFYGLILAVIFGGLLGLLLYIIKNPYFFNKYRAGRALGFIFKYIASYPMIAFFILLLALAGEFSWEIDNLALIALGALASFVFAIEFERALGKAGSPLLQTAIASGVPKWHMLFGIVFPESILNIFIGIINTAVFLLGASTVVGLIGFWGLGGGMILHWEYMITGVDTFGSWLTYPLLIAGLLLVLYGIKAGLRAVQSR